MKYIKKFLKKKPQAPKDWVLQARAKPEKVEKVKNNPIEKIFFFPDWRKYRAFSTEEKAVEGLKDAASSFWKNDFEFRILKIDK